MWKRKALMLFAIAVLSLSFLTVLLNSHVVLGNPDLGTVFDVNKAGDGTNLTDFYFGWGSDTGVIANDYNASLNNSLVPYFISNSTGTTSTPTGTQSQNTFIYGWSYDFFMDWNAYNLYYNNQTQRISTNAAGANTTATYPSGFSLVRFNDSVVLVSISAQPEVGPTFTMTDVAQDITYEFTTPQSVNLTAGSWQFWQPSDITYEGVYYPRYGWLVNGATLTTQTITVDVTGSTSIIALYGYQNIGGTGGAGAGFWLPIMFLIGMIGLVCTFAGPLYLLDKFSKGEGSDSFTMGVMITAIGIGFVIGWLWSV